MDHGSERGPVPAGARPVLVGLLGSVPGQVPIGSRSVRRCIVVHAADNSHAVDLPGQAGEVLADMVAGDVGGQGAKGAFDIAARLGFEVERVEMTQSSPGEDHDTAARLAESGRSCRPTPRRTLREGEVGGQAQAEGSGAEKVTTTGECSGRTPAAWSMIHGSSCRARPVTVLIRGVFHNRAPEISGNFGGKGRRPGGCGGLPFESRRLHGLCPTTLRLSHEERTRFSVAGRVVFTP